MVATFVVGPTLFLILLGTQAIGGMIDNFVMMSLFTGAGPWAVATRHRRTG